MHVVAVLAVEDLHVQVDPALDANARRNSIGELLAVGADVTP